MLSSRIKQVINLVLLIGVLYFIAYTVLLSVDLEGVAQSLGVAGYVVVVFYIILSHVFAPLMGTPGVLFGVSIYGVQKGMWLLYIGSFVSASISFLIARKFGREWVIKLVGKRSMKQVDDFMVVEGEKMLVASRLFGFALFDYISYAAGLTNVAYWRYMVITAVCGLVPNLAFQFAFQNVDVRSPAGTAMWVGSIVVAGLIFGGLVRSYIRKRN